MTVINFPNRKTNIRPVIEVYTPQQSGSGNYEVWLWRNRDRDDGFIYRVPTVMDVEIILDAIKDAFPGRWSRG